MGGGFSLRRRDQKMANSLNIAAIRVESPTMDMSINLVKNVYLSE
jgi:hypothetical protein